MKTLVFQLDNTPTKFATDDDDDDGDPRPAELCRVHCKIVLYNAERADTNRIVSTDVQIQLPSRSNQARELCNLYDLWYQSEYFIARALNKQLLWLLGNAVLITPDTLRTNKIRNKGRKKKRIIVSKWDEKRKIPFLFPFLAKCCVRRKRSACGQEHKTLFRRILFDAPDVFFPFLFLFCNQSWHAIIIRNANRI